MDIKRTQRPAHTYLLPHLDGYALSRRILYKQPLDRVLRGYHLDLSRHPDVLVVSVLVLPLYVPTDHIVFRNGGYIASAVLDADVDEGSVMGTALAKMKRHLPFLDSLSTPSAIIRNLWWTPWTRFRNDVWDREVVAYSYVLLGAHQKARRKLAALQAYCNSKLDKHPSDHWLYDIASRADQLRTTMEVDPTRALALLDEWAESTKRNLKLV